MLPTTVTTRSPTITMAHLSPSGGSHIAQDLGGGRVRGHVVCCAAAEHGVRARVHAATLLHSIQRARVVAQAPDLRA